MDDVGSATQVASFEGRNAVQVDLRPDGRGHDELDDDWFAKFAIYRNTCMPASALRSITGIHLSFAGNDGAAPRDLRALSASIVLHVPLEQSGVGVTLQIAADERLGSPTQSICTAVTLDCGPTTHQAFEAPKLI